MPENSISVRIKSKTQKIREELEEIISSVEGFYLQRVESSEPCDLLIMEMGDDPSEEFRIMNDLQSLGIVGEVFLTSQDTNPETLLKALRTGVREFFPQPFRKEEVQSALNQFRERFRERKEQGKAQPKKEKIINILGSKGGVGTTTVAVNLAVSLAESGGSQSVALLDMSPPFGDVSLFLGIKPAYDWAEAVRNISRLDTAYLTSIFFRHSSGVYVLPSPSRLPLVPPPKLHEEEKATPDEIMGTILEQIRKMFDFVIVDSGQSLEGMARGTLRLADTVLMVTSLSLPSLINVKRILSTFRDLGFPAEKNVQILVNRLQKNSTVSLKEAEASIKKKFLWSIPNNYQLTMSAINQGKPLSALDSGAEISRKFKELSDLLSGRDEGEGKEGLTGFKLPKWLTKVSGGAPIFSRTPTSGGN
ncbi:MAG: AAA family ATPase [bacterium]